MLLQGVEDLRFRVWGREGMSAIRWSFSLGGLRKYGGTPNIDPQIEKPL